MNEQKSNVCSGGPKLIFACSGAADVGAVADQAGIESFEHLRVTDLGLEKGRTAVDDASIHKVVAKGCELLNEERA